MLIFARIAMFVLDIPISTDRRLGQTDSFRNALFAGIRKTEPAKSQFPTLWNDRFPWRVLATNSDQLLKRKQFETLPKVGSSAGELERHFPSNKSPVFTINSLPSPLTAS